MNKMMMGIVCAVCVLGMALIMLNERLSEPKNNLVISDKTTAIAAQPTPSNVDWSNTSMTAKATNEISTVDEFRASAPNAIVREVTKPVTYSVADSTNSAQKPFANLAKENTPESLAHAKQPKIEKSEPIVRPISKTREDIRASEKEARLVASAGSTVEVPKIEHKPQVKHQEETAPKKETVTKVENSNKEVSKKDTKKDSNKKEATKAEDSKKEAAKPGQVKKFVVYNRNTGATVRLHGTEPFKYKTSTMHNPERILVELDGSWKIIAPGVPKNPLVTNVRIGKLPNKTRIVVDLKQKPKNSRIILGKDRQSIDIRVDL